MRRVFRGKRCTTAPVAGIFLVFGIAAGVSLLGCARKGPVRPPQDAAPKAIADLAVTDTVNGLQLEWARPTSYADGSHMDDLGGFEVHRTRGLPGGNEFQRLAVLAVSDRERLRKVHRFRYLDRGVTHGIVYRYQVVSFTLDRYFSEPSNVVTAECRVLIEGNNAPLPTPGR